MNMFRGEIDVCHAHLIDGLVRSFKPQNILELGWGGGRSHNAIAQGVKFNKNKAHYTIVDNWLDAGGSPPPDVHAAVKRHSLNHKTHDAEDNTFDSFSTVTSDERGYIQWAIDQKKQYDFIMSDADHEHSHEWAMDVFEKLLTSPGILIHHDVGTGEHTYEGLGKLPIRYQNRHDVCASMVFDRKTLDYEQCQRGLLVVFKY